MMMVIISIYQVAYSCSEKCLVLLLIFCFDNNFEVITQRIKIIDFQSFFILRILKHHHYLMAQDPHLLQLLQQVLKAILHSVLLFKDQNLLTLLL